MDRQNPRLKSILADYTKRKGETIRWISGDLFTDFVFEIGSSSISPGSLKSYLEGYLRGAAAILLYEDCGGIDEDFDVREKKYREEYVYQIRVGYLMLLSWFKKLVSTLLDPKNPDEIKLFGQMLGKSLDELKLKEEG